MRENQTGQPSSTGSRASASQVTSAVILAGGLGTRLRGVLPDLPKAMAPVLGRPFLEYLMDHWLSQGISRFILSVGYRREILMKHFGGQYHGARIEYAVEEVPSGTGGGLLLALEKLNAQDPFLLLNGDTFFKVSLRELMQFHLKRGADWTFSLFQTEDTKRYLGMKVNAEGRILSMRSDTERSQLANGGVYLVNPKVLSVPEWRPGLKLSLENDIFPHLLESGSRLFGHPCSGSFIDIGLPADLSRAAEILKA